MSETNGAVLDGTLLLTAGQVAHRWQVPKSHIYSLTRSGLMPTVRIGRYYRYRLADLERFEAEGGTGSDE